MALGGRAAEELIFGDITTGASADIQHLTAIARRMVCMFGMSEKLGPVKFGDFSSHPHLRIDGPPPENVSNETEREIDLEVRHIVNEALEEARNCMTVHRDQLEMLAEALLERETLSIAEINELLGLTPPPETTSDTAENVADSVATAENTETEAEAAPAVSNTDGNDEANA